MSDPAQNDYVVDDGIIDQPPLVPQAPTEYPCGDKTFQTRLDSLCDVSFQKMQEMFKCETCRDVLVEPSCVMPCTEHIFCRSCLKDRTSCPVCQTEGSVTNTGFVKKSILSLGLTRVCIGCENGCDATLDLFDHEKVVAHENTCGFVKVPCPIGCQKYLLRRDVESHTPFCSAPLPCRICNEFFPSKGMMAHLQAVCLREEMCQFCDQTYRTAEKEFHAKVCTGAILPCMYHEEIGCKFAGNYAHLMAHYQAEIGNHANHLHRLVKANPPTPSNTTPQVDREKVAMKEELEVTREALAAEIAKTRKLNEDVRAADQKRFPLNDHIVKLESENAKLQIENAKLQSDLLKERRASTGPQAKPVIKRVVKVAEKEPTTPTEKPPVEPTPMSQKKRPAEPAPIVAKRAKADEIYSSDSDE